VVLIGTLPKSMLAGLAAARLTPWPWTLNGIGSRQLPPATGHSNTVVVLLAPPAVVGANVSLTLQVPGPVKPPPVPHVSKSKLNGVFNPLPEATSVR
jgi:hypothetical protein